MELIIHQSGVNCLAVRRLSVDAWVVETGGDDTEVMVTRLVTEAVVQWWEGFCSGASCRMEVSSPVEVPGPPPVKEPPMASLEVSTPSVLLLSWRTRRTG